MALLVAAFEVEMWPTLAGLSRGWKPSYLRLQVICALSLLESAHTHSLHDTKVTDILRQNMRCPTSRFC
jgi:hypothetical protein